METQTIIFILLLVTLSILIITIYVWVFAIEPRQENDKNNLSTIGMEGLNTSTYLLNNKSNATLLKFYDQPRDIDPYVDISYSFNSEPTTLIFDIVNSNDSSVLTSRKIMTTKVDTDSTFREERLYFKKHNTNNDHHTIKYTLDDSKIQNVEIKKIQLS